LPKELGELFPIGRVFGNVEIPNYEEDSLESVMKAETVKRISQDHVDFTDLIFFFYDSSGRPTTSIQMDKAQYHLGTGILTSKTPANIEQERFTMRGDKMTFETDSHLAQLEGDVKMLIFDDKIVNGGRESDSEGAVVITADKSTMDNVNRQITFLGNVLIENEEDNITMKCDKLQVFLIPEGEKVKDVKGKQSKISHAIASGQMIEIKKLDEDGTPQIGLARVAHYNAITKNATLSGGPPTIQDGKGNFVVTKSRDSKIIVHENGRYEITGSESHIITVKNDGKASSFDFGGGIN
ncbi:MAG: LPS export ABC transporter periplasmic protein LptC, partial [Methylococcales bacterium]|nr:LPS export ABC transporter periplasmic protein LptC [Methylococcales bacterium]